MQRLFAGWIAVRSSLWFVPMCVTLLSMGAAQLLIELDGGIAPGSRAATALSFSADGSRALLSGIATAMITVAGVAFSITVVALSLASSQYSPRVLRQFMRDRANQAILGVFVGVFAYCLIVLPQIHDDQDRAVPGLAVLGGIVYALAAIGCLIGFLHHVASSIQASTIVSGIATETRAAIDDVFPQDVSEEEPARKEEDETHWHLIEARESGYIQLLGEQILVRLARKRDVFIRIECQVGAFVDAGTPIARVNRAPDEALAAAVRAAFTISCVRTTEQDVLFGMRQIVDVALRALSPSLNDPTTATLCIDYLNTILLRLAPRCMGDRTLVADGCARVWMRAPRFPDALSTAYGEIQTNIGAQALVFVPMVRGLKLLMAAVRGFPEREAAVARQAATIARLAAAKMDAGFPEVARAAAALAGAAYQ